MNTDPQKSKLWFKLQATVRRPNDYLKFFEACYCVVLVALNLVMKRSSRHLG